MAIIDYHLVHNGLYAKLSPSARILIPVLSTLCDNYTGEIPPHQAKAAVLGKLAGLSPKYVRAALRELAQDQYKIVALKMGSGRISSIQYRPVIRLAKQNKAKPVIMTEETGHNDRFNNDSLPPETPPEPAEPQPSTRTANSLLLFKQPDQETTTSSSPPLPSGKSAADKVKGDVIRTMEHRHGHKVIKDVLDAMKYLNGEVKNPSAFFIWCVQNKTIPSHQVIEKRKKAEEAERKAREREEKAQREWKEMAETIRKEQNDPEAQVRIRAIQENFLNSC